MTLKYLLQKEFLQLRRNAFLPRLIVMFPIVIMCVMPWVMSMEVRNVVVDVVDHDRSASSTRLVQRIAASRYFIFGGLKPGYAEAMDDVERMDADIILEIPPHYERDIVSGRAAQVLVAANAVNGSAGQIGAQYMGSIVTQDAAGGGAADGAEALSVLNLYNKSLNYKLFMIPSLMAILVMLMCGFLPALNIVGEKEKGTAAAMNVTPVSKWAFILAKLIPYWLVAMVVMTLCFLLAWLVYGITCAGSLPLVYLLAMLFAFVFSGIGLLVSNCNSTMQQAVFMMWFIVVCMLLLSGLFTPVRSMPWWAYATTYVNPMHYFIDAVRTVFVRGGDFASVAHQVVALTVIAVTVNLLAVVSYRKNS